jgi:putative membrane-bound dehydrogenase-like protein
LPEVVFDLASLTKPIATASALMLLVEQGKLKVTDPLAKHLSAFRRKETERITLEQMLLHTSGFIPDNPELDYKDGVEKAWERLFALSPIRPPSSQFAYSDVNYILLGKVVETVSGQPLDVFTHEYLYAPLGLNETRFNPQGRQKEGAAPTEMRNGAWMLGEVHDPRAYALGGVAGHAGLFSTADDLAVFAQMLLQGGEYSDQRVLKTETVKLMTAPHEVPLAGGKKGRRTYGWDMDTSYSSNRGEVFPADASYGHSGFTGTSIWIDPRSQTAVIVLANSVHPKGKGDMRALRRSVATLAAKAVQSTAKASMRSSERPPHNQDTVPGPALTPVQAIAKMQVPPGFHIELVAAEPRIVNPVAMTFDERGRIWITESLEYPRQSAGPGRDRIKILESTKGDGNYDKITIFAEGLNIPSGIAVGHGGVWVANSPDILFYKEGPDGKAAGKPEVVVSGFGRSDTHELPNSLTWGPDGWLYGLSGVFNYSHVKQDGKDFRFTCAMFRIDPKSKKFELFCEGTSNPWGIAFDTEGSAFVSACVIDHLWHLVQTGYYHRQGGPYPPFTWKIDSIVKHHHQKAAYCGLHFFDSDAYPPEYREKLYMGNIHGNCINVDELTREGSTYFARPRPDFLTANDAWFMPVSQRTGPDGCLYILDWYDRYHCYQDAQRDPGGIDRLNGRLYRVVYKDYKAAGKFDLSKESDEQLIQRLHSPNIFYREIAQRLLSERVLEAAPYSSLLFSNRVVEPLQKLVLDERVPRNARMHALWALVGSGHIYPDLLRELLTNNDAGFRAWGVRATTKCIFKDLVTDDRIFRAKLNALAYDPSPEVKLQVAIAAPRIKGLDAMALLLIVAAESGDDKLIPHIVWQNLQPLLNGRSEEFVGLLHCTDLRKTPGLAAMVPKAIDRFLAGRDEDRLLVPDLLSLLTLDKDSRFGPAHEAIVNVVSRIQSREIDVRKLEPFRVKLAIMARNLLSRGPTSPLYVDAAVLAAAVRDKGGRDEATVNIARDLFAASMQPEDVRVRLFDALLSGGDKQVVTRAISILADSKKNSTRFRGQILAALGRRTDSSIAATVLTLYPRMEKEVQPRAIELLTQRTGWSKQLLQAIGEKKISPDALNVNQVRKLLASRDPELVNQVRAHWGTLRDGRNPEREKVVAAMRIFLGKQRGDPMAGWKVFKNVCAQCHKIYGEGVDVGPDITANGRSDFNQLLSNVFDPSLVIGAGYQATTVLTTKGQALTGLVVEDNVQRVVLKTQGGKLETIPRAEVETLTVSQVSLMPEGLEKQLRPQEIADLFAFLSLDRPPTDPHAKRIAGTPR